MTLELLAFLVLVAAVGRWVLAPLSGGRAAAGTGAAGDLSALEAERDLRVAAVRDAELDLQTGKLSADDHRALDARLRAEALEALRALDAARSGREDER